MIHGKNKSKTVTLLLSSLLILALAIGGTLAYLSTKTTAVTNTFTPSELDGKVEEKFDGSVKKNVNVKNTGDIDAYIRVKLVTYRVNLDGSKIGGNAEIPDFTPGTNWVERDGYYYYTLPVKPGDNAATDLIGDAGIKLKTEYEDADGGKQVIEVMAEVIQSDPAEAVGEAWGVSISKGSVTPYKGKGGTK